MRESSLVASGRAWVFGNDVNTDVIHPPHAYSLEPDKVRRGLFTDARPEMVDALQSGDILVAGRNFGCGSSRETCVRSLLLNRIGAVVAVSFGRIFFRSATNSGIRCFEFQDPDDVARVDEGDWVRILDGRWVLEVGSERPAALRQPHPFIQSIWRAGGLLEMLESTR